MHLYDEDENEGQGRFFSPAKIARVRERMLVAEDAQRQHQLTAQDKKLQAAIQRAEKAREAEERKQERQTMRQTIREQLAREKAERQAIREAQRAEKITEATRRKREAEDQRVQRIQAKEAKKATVQSRKRSLEEDEVDQPQKRPCTNASRIRSTGNSRASSIQVDTRVAQQSIRTISQSENRSEGVQQEIEVDGQISHSGRSGRAVRLPTRFR